jgi:hypothetical protein
LPARRRRYLEIVAAAFLTTSSPKLILLRDLSETCLAIASGLDGG